MKNTVMMTIRITALTVAILIMVCGCMQLNSNRETLRPVKVQLKWLHQAQFAGIYSAIERGFYNDHGIAVENLSEFDYKNSPVDVIEDKKADFAVAGTDELIIARSQGRAQHVKAIAVIYRTNSACFYSLKESGITKPTDFIGKTVGIERASDGSELNVGILYSAMMKNLKINRSQINEINIGYDAAELLDGRTDISSGYIINEPNYAIEAGKKLNIILAADYGVNMYADIIVAHEDTIKNNPKLVEDFLRGTLEGWQYAIENEEGAINDTMKYANHSSREHQANMLRASIPLIHTGDNQLGMMQSKEWEGAQRILFSQQIISKPVGPDTLYTLEFLDKIYNIPQKTTIPVRLLWLHQNQFAGFYAAQQLGYYTDEGIDVALHSAGYGAPVEQRLLSGEDMFGVMHGPEFVKSISMGNKLHAIGVIYNTDPDVFISLKEKNITKPEDLKGKTIACTLSTPERVQIALNKAHLNTSDVTLVQKKFGINSLYDKNVDVVVGMAFNELQEAENQGLDVNVMTAKDLDIDYYANVIITTDETIKNNPELVMKFMAATLKGWKYVKINPSQSTGFVYSYDTGLNPEFQDKMLTSSLTYINPLAGTKIGMMDDEVWDRLIQSMYEIGELNNTMNASDIFTNRFIE